MFDQGRLPIGRLALQTCGRAIVSIVCVLACALVACDSTSETARKARQAQNDPSTGFVATTSSPATATDLLTQSIATYRRLSSYQDEGFVSLKYSIDGQPVQDKVPLSVAWSRDGKLGLRAYEVWAGPRGDRWHLKIDRPERPFVEQVLSRDVPSTVTYDWLLDDPFVGEALAAGPTGFPAQLHLLLGEAPFSRLLTSDTKVSFQPSASIDGRACQVVLIEKGTAKYSVWVDRASLLIRRIIYPQENLPQELLQDSRLTGVQLSVEMQSAEANAHINWTRFYPEFEHGSRFVTHFVPPEHELDTRGLDQTLPAFELLATDGTVAMESIVTNARGKTLAMMWLADHPASKLAIEQMTLAKENLRKLDAEAAKKVEFISVWAQPSPPAEMSYEQLRKEWNIPGTLVVDSVAMGRDLLNVMEAPTLVVLDAANRLQIREERANPMLGDLLPQLLVRCTQGENLAAQAIERSKIAKLRSTVELQKARAIDDIAGSWRAHNYPPVNARLTEISRLSLTSPPITTTTDRDSLVWQLTLDGHIYVQSPLGDTKRRIDTPWQLRAGTAYRMELSGDGRYIALATNDGVSKSDSSALPEQGALVQLFRIKTQKNQTVGLSQHGAITDFCWLSVQGSDQPRLAVAMEEGQMVLLDPQNRDQLSGQCSSRPMAFLVNSYKPVGGDVVLESGSVEPLLLGSPTSATLARSVAFSLPPSATGKSTQRLDFQPSNGPWFAATSGKQNVSVDGQAGDSTDVLARGWLAKNEPALFMLDSELNRRWHYRLPVGNYESPWPLASQGIDPVSGTTVWAILDSQQSVHLLRHDGQATDHFGVGEKVRGIALTPDGDRLLLRIVQPTQSTIYQLEW